MAVTSVFDFPCSTKERSQPMRVCSIDRIPKQEYVNDLLQISCAMIFEPFECCIRRNILFSLS